MSAHAQDLFTAALALPLEQRAALAEVLVDSLPQERQSDIDRAWKVEVRRRIEAFDRGEMEATPAEEVFTELLGEGDE